MSIDFNTQLELAGNHALRARIFYDLMWFYNGAETRPIILDTMNEYPEFFRWDEHAHLLSFVIYAYRLFEKRPDTINLNKLLEDLGQQVGSSIIARPKALLTLKEPLIKKLKILRNKAMAHSDHALRYDDVFRLADIHWNELRNLTEISLHVINVMRQGLNLSELNFWASPIDDAKRVLSKLSDHADLWPVSDETPLSMLLSS